LESKIAPDATDWRIVRSLKLEARLSLAELGRRVKLTAPAVAERVRRLEEAGILAGYHAHVPADRTGRPIGVFVRMRVPPEKYKKVLPFLRTLDEVIECHHLSGEDAFLIRAAVESIPALEEFVRTLSEHGQTATSLILSSPITEFRRDVETRSYPRNR